MKKKALLFAALSIFLYGCTQQEMDYDVNEQKTLTALMEVDEQTKSDATDAGVFSWSKGDQIWIQTTGGHRIGALNGNGGSAIGSFQYTLVGSEKETGYAIYPYHANHTITNETISVVLPSVYELGETLRNTNAIMLASPVDAALAEEETGKENSYVFNHLAGVLRFKFKNVPSGTDKFSLSLGGAKINGTFDVKEDQILSDETSNAGEQVTALKFKALEQDSDITLFVPVPVGTYNGMTLKFYKGEDIVWEFESTKQNTLARRNLARLPEIEIKNASGEIVNYISDNEALKSCLTKNVENIVVRLNADLSYDIAAWENDAMGGESTKTITIDGNGHTLTFNQTNSDWNNIVTVNNAKLIIKNAKITNSGYNDGPWNRHDLNFACPVELIDVDSDKAFAFKNAASLTDVTISDANTSDTYAIWIQPKGQTVTLDGCTIDMIDCTDGRGIKIDNQYLDAETEKKVTLTVKNTVFKTEEKSAILVKTTVGADITVENINIENVAADNEYPVWVDGDALSSYALVNVNGCQMRAEDIESDAALKTLLTVNAKDIVAKLGNDLAYEVAAWENNAMGGELTETITILGNDHTLTFNQTNSDWNNIVTVNNAKLIIKNAKITNSGHNDGPWNRHDLNFACPVELVDVDSDKAFAFKNAASLTDVTISDANTSDTYAIWIQPKGQTVTLDGCTIDMIDCTDGRGIKIDNQYLDAETEKKVTLTVKNTVFKTEEKSAILVKTTVGADITVENINIENVAADNENAVWVDVATASYKELVTVTGCTKIVEP